MRGIPRAPLALMTLAVLPFLWGALTQLSDTLFALTMDSVGPRFVGPYMPLFYGTVLLAFLSGILWGFASRAPAGQAATGYVLASIPAAWAFVMTGGGPASAGVNLMTGFAATLLLDIQFRRWGLAPAWWLPLRVPMTLVVVACLAVGVWR